MLETARLRLREPIDDDAARLAAYYARNEPRFAFWEPEADDEAGYKRWIAWRRQESGALRGRSFLAFDRADAEALVAVVNLYGISSGATWGAVLGYSLDGAYEGRGFAHEAVGAVIGYAFGTLRLHRVVANYQPANERSGRLLRRLGFTVEGYGREMIRIRGTWRDHLMTALLNPEWEAPA